MHISNGTQKLSVLDTLYQRILRFPMAHGFLFFHIIIIITEC